MEPRDIAAVVFAAVLEVVVVASAMRGGGGLAVALLLHFCAVAALGVATLQARRRGGDLSVPLLAAILVTAAGPAGALVALGALPGLARPALGGALLDAWYRRIGRSTSTDPATRLSDRVAADRVLRTAAPSPRSYIDVVAEGALSEQQAVLGQVARNFHPRYLPTLATALQAPTPVLRVQAAAVAAHVRPRLDGAIATALARAGDIAAGDTSRAAFAERLALIRELETAAASGLLDGATASAALTAATALTAHLDPLLVPLGRVQSPERDAAVELTERRLIETADYRGLRLLRRRRRLAAIGFDRLRRGDAGLRRAMRRRIRPC